MTEEEKSDFLKTAPSAFRKAVKHGIEIIHPVYKPGTIFSLSMRGDKWLHSDCRKELYKVAGNRPQMMLLDNVRLTQRLEHLYDVHIAVLVGNKVLFLLITAGINDDEHRDPQYNTTDNKVDTYNVWNLFDKLFVAICHSSEKEV